MKNVRVSKNGPPFRAWRTDRNGLSGYYPTPHDAVDALLGRKARRHSKLERRLFRAKYSRGLRTRQRFLNTYRQHLAPSLPVPTSSRDHITEFMRDALAEANA